MKSKKAVFVASILAFACIYSACNESTHAAPAESCTVSTCKDANTVYICQSGTKIEKPCAAGCNMVSGTCNPEPLPDVCAKDLCKDDNTLMLCHPDGSMTPQTCPNGCDPALNACKSKATEPGPGPDGKCKSNVCKDASTLLKCDINTGSTMEERCENGCDAALNACKPQSEHPTNPEQPDPENPKIDQPEETAAIAPSYANKKGNALNEILGANVVDGGVNFAVFAKNATRVEVLLFDRTNPNTDPIQRIPMTKDSESGIWTLFAKGLGEGTTYGYIAFGPNWNYDESFTAGSQAGFVSDVDANGNRYNPNKLLIDPYTRRTAGEFDWKAGGNPLTGEGRNINDWKYAPKSVVAKSAYQWSENESTWRSNRQKGDGFQGHGVNDLIIYEVQPKGFTQAGGTVAHPGTWKGIGEKAAYLAELGVTAVELMPVAEKNSDGTYWGYDTIAFFAPEQQLAIQENQSKPGGVLDEFKEMVDKLHQAGIEVIIDVVYGQTGEGGFWTEKLEGSDYEYPQMAGDKDTTALPIYSFRGLDNKEYYHLVNNNYHYLNQTGVGNQTRANYGPFHRLIMDNIHFWAEEMHVDGFRFDLASVLGVSDSQITSDGDSKNFDNGYWMANAKNTIIQEIIDDEVMKKYNTRIIAEPWSATQFALGGFTKSSSDSHYAWSEWNGRFRDLIKSLVNYDSTPFNSEDTMPPDWQPIDIGNILTGSSKMFGDDGRHPYNSINYITSHDGFTLYDTVTYTDKHNDCGKINPVCCTNSTLPFCGLSSGPSDNKSRNWCLSEPLTTIKTEDGSYDIIADTVLTNGHCPKENDEAKKREILRAFFTFLLTSPGTPMLLGGDEYMRTLYGNNNSFSYGADNEYNWMRWDEWQKDGKRQQMHDFVRDLIKIRKQYSAFLAPKDYSGPTEWVAHERTTASDMWNGRTMGLYYKQTGSTPSLFIMINLDPSEPRSFSFPESGEWKVLVDTQAYFESTGTNTWFDGSRPVSSSYELKPRTIVIISK